MNTGFLVTLLLAIPAAAAQHEPQRHLVDLSVHPPRAEGQTVRGGCFAGESGTAPAQLPVRLTFRGILPRSHVIGERVMYEITIKNLGPETITLPWLPSQSLAEIPADQVLMARIALEVRDEERRALSFAPGALEGTPAVPRSTVVLQRGDQATVPVGGTSSQSPPLALVADRFSPPASRRAPPKSAERLSARSERVDGMVQERFSVQLSRDEPALKASATSSELRLHYARKRLSEGSSFVFDEYVEAYRRTPKGLQLISGPLKR